MSPTAIWICLAVVVLAAAFDFRTGKMPNRITIGGFLVAIAVHAAIGCVDAGALGGLRGAAHAALGGIACGVIPFLGWRRGEMGGGDVKLFVAIGAFLGPGLGTNVMALSLALAFLVLLPYRLLRHGGLKARVGNLRIGLVNMLRRRAAKLPYIDIPKLPPVVLGPTIAVALLVILVAQGAFA